MYHIIIICQHLTMVNYLNSVVYKIVCNDADVTECYIGSTTNLYSRTLSHRTACRSIKHPQHLNPLYTSMRVNGGWENWSVTILEKCPCNARKELLARERHWYDITPDKLNKNVPNSGKAESSQRHALKNPNLTEYNKRKSKEYYSKNRDAHIKYVRRAYLTKKAKRVLTAMLIKRIAEQ